MCISALADLTFGINGNLRIFSIMKLLQNKPVMAFIGLTFLLSWLLIFLFRQLGYHWNTPAAYVVIILYMYIPLSSVVILHKLTPKESLAQSLGVSFKFNRWFVAAWLLPLAGAALALLFSTVLPGVALTSDRAAILEHYARHMDPGQLER